MGKSQAVSLGFNEVAELRANVKALLDDIATRDEELFRLSEIIDSGRTEDERVARLREENARLLGLLKENGI